MSQSAYLIGRVRSFMQPQTLIWTLIPDIRHTGQASKLGKGNTQDSHNIRGTGKSYYQTSRQAKFERHVAAQGDDLVPLSHLHVTYVVLL